MAVPSDAKGRGVSDETSRPDPAPAIAPDDGEFKPYVPDETSLPELTLVALTLGIIQAAFFGLADAYLALKIGMTVGASIPAAVISMAILRGVLKRGSILENNLVQNMASVGESLAAGAVFTLPALYLLQDSLAKSGQPQPYQLNMFQLYFAAAVGGLMGILFMIPLRRSLIVKEHGKLRYPEGTACAEVLMAGDRGGQSAATVFLGILVAGVYRLLMNGLGLWKEIVVWPVRLLKTELSFDLLPSLLAVGFIIGLPTCGVMVSGALLGWFVFIPLISYFGAGLTTVIAPGKVLIAEMGPFDIWDHYLRYIGAGAVACGGLISLMRALPTIYESIVAALSAMRRAGTPASDKRTSRDIPLPWLVGGCVLLYLVTGLNTGLNLAGFVGATLAVVFAFFFVTVSSRIVGQVGSTSMPLSGMTIGALLVTCLVVKAYGLTGAAGQAAALVVAAMVCIAISMGGDISQDLKIGFLVGATPRWVQVTQIISVLVSAAVVSWIVQLLAPGVVDHTFQAPQANLLHLITKGVIEGTLPWIPVLIGMGVAACVEMCGVGSLPFAVGLYLPLELSTTIVFGGLIHWAMTLAFPERLHKAIHDHGLLICSGYVAGDALVGVALAMLAARGIDFSKTFASYPVTQSQLLSCVMFALLLLYLTVVLIRFARSQYQERP